MHLPKFSKPRMAVVGLLLLAASTVAALRLLNPQCGWLVYVFQYRIWPGEGRIEIPDHYDGVWREWYPNGLIQSEVTYADGMNVGPAWYWYENGQCEMEFTETTLTQWRRDGRMACERHFQANKEHGPSRFWLASGDLLECRFFHGELDGSWSMTGTDERVLDGGEYAHGVLVQGRAFPWDYLHCGPTERRKP